MWTITPAGLPATSYPYLICYYRAHDLAGAEPVHTIRVERPGPYEIPQLKRRYGPVWCRVFFPDASEGAALNLPMDLDRSDKR